MKDKKIILFSILFFLINGCDSHEPNAVGYEFRIINKTKTILYLESENKNSNVGLKKDTIFQNQEFMTAKLGFCYKNYHDTLISSFFSKLEIKTAEKKVKIDPFVRANWKESLALKGFSLFCKGGKVYYTLVIKDSDL